MLGIIDWGIGGIGVYHEIKALQPKLPILYFSDTGATPYGKLKRFDLAARLDNVVGFLRSNGAAEIMIACNAASTAIPDLAEHGLRVEGIIRSAVTAALKQNPVRLGVIGGRRTVLSGVYRKRFAEHGFVIKQRIAQPLSALIEKGDTSSDLLRTEAKRILMPLRNCSHILLACTHYPAIEEMLTEFVSPQTRFIDPAKEMAAGVPKPKIKAIGTDRFFTTGSEKAMKTAALNAFGVRIGAVERVRLPE